MNTRSTHSAPITEGERTWIAVVAAYQVCARRFDQLLDHFDLTAAQYDVLVSIDRLGDRALPKHLASALLVTRGNVTGLLDRLGRRGLIALDPHPDDGRARIARLTAEGQRLLDRARPTARRFIEAQMQPFDAASIRATGALMQQMRDHLEALDVDTLLLTESTGVPA